MSDTLDAAAAQLAVLDAAGSPRWLVIARDAALTVMAIAVTLVLVLLAFGVLAAANGLSDLGGDPSPGPTPCLLDPACATPGG